MRDFSTGLKRGVLLSILGVFGSAFMWLLGFKVVAFWMGPEGVGLFSQLRQMAQAATLGATFGGTNSVVQGLSERPSDVERSQFRAMAGRLIGVTGFGVTSLILIFAPSLTQFFLSSNAPNMVATVRWLSLAVLLNIGGTYALAVLNGYRRFSFLALAQIGGPLALVIWLFVAWWLPLPSEPQLLAGSFILCFGVTCAAGWIGLSRLPTDTSASVELTSMKVQQRIFLGFAVSNLIAALSTTLALLLIRSWVIDVRGLAFAGLFDAGWTLTFNYTTLFLTACNAIYLPLLTSAAGLEQQKRYVLRTAYLVLGASVLMCYGIVLAKEHLIALLYSQQFQESEQVLMVLVIAVMFRGVSWVYGTMILATRSSRVLLVSDLALNLTLLAAIRYSLQHFGSLSALSWAFVLPNFLYLVFVVEYARHKNPLVLRRQIWPLLTVGVAPLFYLALGSEKLQGAYSGMAVWFCVFIGLGTSCASFWAYRKVMP